MTQDPIRHLNPQYVQRRSRDAAKVTAHLPDPQSPDGHDWKHDEETVDLEEPLRPEDKFENLVGRSASIP